MKLGIMGFGHIGQAFVKGLLNKGLVDKENIYITARSAETLDNAKSTFGINVCDDHNELIKVSDLIIVCLSSRVFFEEANTFDLDSLNNKVVVSFMAGVKIAAIKEVLGDISVVRAMPNLGMADNEGVTAYTDTDHSELIRLFNGLGYSFVVDESDIEKVTALASCGVGFAAYILACFNKIGLEYGFDQEITLMIVRNIFNNALKSDDHEKLVSSVATKGGATEAGIHSFNEDKLYDVIHNGVNKAYLKMTNGDR